MPEDREADACDCCICSDPLTGRHRAWDWAHAECRACGFKAEDLFRFAPAARVSAAAG